MKYFYGANRKYCASKSKNNERTEVKGKENITILNKGCTDIISYQSIGYNNVHDLN